MANSLLLNVHWDISLDDNGNLQSTTGNYALAQNCASACRAFTQDMYFAQTEGIPHFSVDISTKLNPVVVANALEKECLKNSEVASAQFIFEKQENRVISGDLEITAITGETFNVTI